MKEAYFCSEVIFMEVTPFKSCANGDGIYCLLTTRIFAKMLKNRIKMGQYRYPTYLLDFDFNLVYNKLKFSARKTTSIIHYSLQKSFFNE